MPKQTKVYWCDCQKYCNGIERAIGRKTYFAYKKFQHNPCLKFSQQYWDFLDKYPVLPDLLSDVLWSSQNPSAWTTTATGGPLSQCTCQSTDLSPNNIGRVLVGALLYKQI